MGKRRSALGSSGTLPTSWAIARLYAEENQDDFIDEDFRRVDGFIRNRDYRRLVTLCQSRMLEYYSIRSSRVYAQVAAFFSKNANLSDDASCTLQAKLNFERAERICRITNRRLAYYDAHPSRCKFLAEVERMRACIARVLGDVRDFCAVLPGSMRLTGGATASTPRARSQKHRKVRKVIPCTLRVAKLLDRLWRPDGRPMRYELTTCNRVTCVPKNYKTHRTIAAEPTGNLPFQLAVDKYVKNRLRLVNVDLSSQLRNQQMARTGSLDGSIATIDMSMASDTVALELVHYLCHVVNSLASRASPYGRLAETLSAIIAAEGLPFVPWNEDSGSGVWVSMTHARALRLFRTNKATQSLETRHLVEQRETRYLGDARTYILWLLEASGRDRSGHTELVTSGIGASGCNIRRVWVAWRYHATGEPHHLSLWWGAELSDSL